MKKIITSLCLLSAMTGLAQSNWPATTTADFDSDRNAVLGTKNNRSLYLRTADTTRVTIDSTGNLVVAKLAHTDDDGYHPVYANKNGVLVDWTAHLPDLSFPCMSNKLQWYEGGNNIQVGGSNIIGTCNNVDFVLEAGGKHVIDISSNYNNTSTGMVGIGENNAPSVLLDISDPRTSLNTSNVREHTLIHGDGMGAIEATYDMNLYFGNEFHINSGSYGGGSGNDHILNLNLNGDFGLSNMSVLADGKTTIGSQPSQLNAAMVNVNVSGSSAGAVNAIDVFDHYTGTSGQVNFRVKSDGSVYARYVKVTALTNVFPDYVFEKDYKLRSLKDVEAYYKLNKHLEGIPSATEVEKNGLDMGEINSLLLKKVEELTIYTVEQNKKTEALQAAVEELQKQLQAVKNSK